MLAQLRGQRAQGKIWGPGSMNRLLSLDWPSDLYLAVLHDAIAQIEIDEALVRHAGIRCHVLEIGHHVFGEADRDRPLQARGVGIPA